MKTIFLTALLLSSFQANAATIQTIDGARAVAKYREIAQSKLTANFLRIAGEPIVVTFNDGSIVVTCRIEVNKNEELNSNTNSVCVLLSK